ncbi:MAG TPA: NAD-dependent epimerase/dehydratase family protein [Elusimicrobiota bacterium]|nr:NAD-dependent epimerase/dehydratase family protein [Elusimicrobiota bacterium]
MKSRALVTGAAGFVGANVCKALARQGRAVTGLDDFSAGSFKNLAGFSGDFVAADVFDAAVWGPRVGQVDAVFHQAAITDTTVMDQAKMMRVNAEAFYNLLEWAAKNKVKSVVYASSAGVYGDTPVPMRETAAHKPLNIYAFSKATMENIAADFPRRHPKSRMNIVGLRYFNVFGPGESFKGKAASMIWQLYLQMKAGKRPRVFEFGDQYRDFIYVKDVVAANVLAEKAKSGAYNVCTGRKTTFNEIIAALNAVLGARLEPDYFKNPYSFYQNETLGDPALARKALGFSAKFTAEAAIRDYLEGPAVPVGV